jgi:hypothetical protein
MDTSPHLSGQPGSDMDGLEDAPSGVTAAGKKMNSTRTKWTTDSCMVACLFVFHTRKQSAGVA